MPTLTNSALYFVVFPKVYVNYPLPQVFGEGQDSVTSLPASLALARPPSLVLEPLKSSSLGRDVLLECRVRQPQAQDTRLMWLREEAPVVEGDRLRLVEGEASLGLLLSGVTEQDWGRSEEDT